MSNSMIALEHISKIYTENNKSFTAVDDVSLNIEKGEIFGVVGYSGAGKSTLIRCINLLEVPTYGKVVIDGVDLTKLKQKVLRVQRKNIGMIFQHFNLMPSRTVFDNVAYSLYYNSIPKSEIRERVIKLLDLVGIGEKANVYPGQLSGGQKQRVAIARALANDPKILLCDEATSALDPQMTESILTLLKELNEKLKLTIVVITHEMAVVKELCHRIAIMQNGKIVEQGNTFEIFANPQSNVTKEFINTTSSMNKIYDLLKSKNLPVQLGEGKKIVMFKYLRKSCSEPLIATLAVKYNVTANILYSDLIIVDGSPLGGITAVISGSEEDIKRGFDYLEEKNVRIEVVKE